MRADAWLQGLLAGSMVLLLFSGAGARQRLTPAATPPPRKTPEEFRRLLPRKAPAEDMVFVGKTVCSFRYPLILRQRGRVMSLNVVPGQEVARGEPLFAYQPLPASTEAAELGQAAAALGEALAALEKDAPACRQRLSALEEWKETWLRSATPAERVLQAPVDGRVLWVHSDLRPGSLPPAHEPVVIVGVLTPMLIRTLVYEQEALRLEPGDRAVAYPESMPGKKFRAVLTRLSWTPVSLDPVQPSYFEAEFTVDNPREALREGLRVIVHMHKPFNR